MLASYRRCVESKYSVRNCGTRCVRYSTRWKRENSDDPEPPQKSSSTPEIRREIQASTLSEEVLARTYGVSRPTIRKSPAIGPPLGCTWKSILRNQPSAPPPFWNDSSPPLSTSPKILSRPCTTLSTSLITTSHSGLWVTKHLFKPGRCGIQNVRIYRRTG